MRTATVPVRRRRATLPAVATIIWVGAGLVAGRMLLAAPTPAAEVLAPAAEVETQETIPTANDVAANTTRTVAALGLAEQAAAAVVRGGDVGRAELARLPMQGAMDLVVGQGDHYVERLTVVDLQLDGDTGVVVVRADALRITSAGYEPAGPVLVSVPIAVNDRGWALAGQPLTRPVGTSSTGLDG